MLRYKIAGLSILLISWAHATPQFSQAECITLNQQRLELRKQLRQPYDAAHGQRLQQELRELERLLAQHCKKPVKTPPSVQPLSRQSD
ncbi:hypothetical protein [Rheinheimera fenheensis]|uniref:hypothetical protein n=1 Tax=Rheinheimera fenheensis TaxID=3152295 RepID=UPI00325CF540